MNILITGCSSGLGQAILHALSDFNVYSHARKNANLVGDITNKEFILKFANFIRDTQINVLINNAGVYTNQTLENTSPSEIIKIINTNLTAQILLTQAFLKNSAGNRKIININSTAGNTPTKNESIYCATKAGLRAFSKSLQLELIDSGVEIIDIYPGGMKTKITKNRHNYNKLIEPEEVAALIKNSLTTKTLYLNEIYIRKRNTSSSS